MYYEYVKVPAVYTSGVPDELLTTDQAGPRCAFDFPAAVPCWLRQGAFLSPCHHLLVERLPLNWEPTAVLDAGARHYSPAFSMVWHDMDLTCLITPLSCTASLDYNMVRTKGSGSDGMGLAEWTYELHRKSCRPFQGMRANPRLSRSPLPAASP